MHATCSILPRVPSQTPFDGNGGTFLRPILSCFIVAETHALLLSRAGRRVAATTLAEIDRDDITVIRVREADEQRAREIIYQCDDKDFSLTDATSFAVMERLHIVHAFAFDHHFTQFGVTILGPTTRM